jgi:hypothetical protein
MIENVLRGVVLLNERVPNWKPKVNGELLDMDSPYRDILGQLFGSYHRGLGWLGLGSKDSVYYGFNPPEDSKQLYLDLTQLWKEQL